MWRAIRLFFDKPLAPDKARPNWIDIGLGAVGLLGCIAAIAFDIIAVRLSAHHTFVKSTVSALAGGERGWIMDLGITGFAIGMLAVAAGLWRWPNESLRWKAGTAILALAACGLLVIAYYDAYAEPVTQMIVIHDSLVAVTGLAFSLTLALLSAHMGNMREGFGYASIGLLALWLLPWPAVYLVPDAYSGAVERISALAMIAWLAMTSFFLIQKGRGVLPK